MTATKDMVPVKGNTYPVKEQLKALGGRWNADQKLWMVPSIKESEAKSIVSNAPVQKRKPLGRLDIIAIGARKQGLTPGVCASCGDKCKYPYTECWGCKEERDMGY
jgi:hypothetical protein